VVRRSWTVNEKETVEVEVELGLPVGLMRLYQGVPASPDVQ
jgi:hypothetical protein